MDLLKGLSEKLGDEARKLALRQVPDILGWGEKFMSDHFTKGFSKMHRSIGRGLEMCATKKNVKMCRVAPRGYGKSTVVSGLFPMYCIANDMKRYILLVSDTEEQAKHFLELVKFELLHNEKLKEAYPTVCGKGSEWSKERIITKNGVCVEALGTGQRIRGRKFLSFRPDLVVVDDPQSDDDIYSPTTLEKQWSWFLRGLMKCGSDDATYLVLGTNLHEKCIVSNIKSTPGWDYKTYRAIIDWPLNMHLWEKWEGFLKDISVKKIKRDEQAMDFYLDNKEAMDEGARVIWPEKEQIYALMLQRAEDHAAFESEKQNNPRSGKRYAFPEEYLSGDIWFFDRELREMKGTPVSVIAVDPAKGAELKKNDYTGIIALHLINRAIYVEPIIKRIPVNQMITELISLARVLKPLSIAFEENTFQYLVADQFEKSAMDMGFPIAVDLINNQTNKNVRIQRLAPFLSRKMFRFKKACPFTSILMEQLKDFPFGKHDDGPDVLEMALRTLLNVLDKVEIGGNNINELSASNQIEQIVCI